MVKRLLGKQIFDERRSMIKKSLMCIACLLISIDYSIAESKIITIGDMPYNAEQQKILDNQIIPIIRTSRNDFVVHLGDFIAGGDFLSCRDDNITKARDYIYSLHPNKVFYTPGDNDWTDCDRDSKTQRFSEYDRLSYLRDVFYTIPPAYPKKWNVIQQANYPENAIWIVNNIVYATLHVVGTNNGRTQILLDNPDEALQHVLARDKANMQWIQRVKNYAMDYHADAIMIFSQADVTVYKDKKQPCTKDNQTNCNGFDIYRKATSRIAEEFKKPVFYIHGDTAAYCIDKNFGGHHAPNLWRVNAPGDFKVIDALEIIINRPDNDKVLSNNDIIFRGLLSGDELKAKCGAIVN